MYPLLRSIYYNGNMSIMCVTPQSIIIVHERIALLMRNKYVIEPEAVARKALDFIRRKNRFVYIINNLTVSQYTKNKNSSISYRLST